MALNANLGELTDEQLVEVVRSKNQELYGEVIKRYQTKLVHYLKKFIHSDDELKDVLQDVFIKAFRNLYSFDTSKRFSPWIYRITHNEAINYIKKHWKETILLDDNDWLFFEDKQDFIDNLDITLTKSLIEKELSLIKDKYREPLILYFFEQKSYEEISEMLKIPKSTVGILILRGKKILKENLEKQYARN